MGNNKQRQQFLSLQHCSQETYRENNFQKIPRHSIRSLPCWCPAVGASIWRSRTECVEVVSRARLVDFLASDWSRAIT